MVYEKTAVTAIKREIYRDLYWRGGRMEKNVLVGIPGPKFDGHSRYESPGWVVIFVKESLGGLGRTVGHPTRPVGGYQDVDALELGRFAASSGL